MINDKTFNELIKKAHNGDKEARDIIILENMRLVYSLAKKYAGMECYESIVQSGMIGLIKSVDKFEVNKGVKFVTYAFYLIKCEMHKHIRDEREDIPFKLKRKDFELYGKIQNSKNILDNKLNREPKVLEIAKHTGVDAKHISEAINAVENNISLQNMKHCNNNGEEDIFLIDSIADRDEMLEDKVINKVLIDKALDKLTEKQRKVIKLRYYKNLTQSDVAKILNKTQVTISRIERKALKLLKEVI